ncbi:MAG: PilN domain-containing protein [Chloroflexota bacterium]
MAKKTVTLYVDDTSLRLLVADGKEIKEWAEQPLEPGLIKNNVVVAESEVANRVQQLINAQQVATNKVIVGMSGLRCLTRPLLFPQLPKEMLEEAVRREAKRMLPVSPDQLYLSWQAIPAPDGKTQLFLVGLPRATADAFCRTLHLAGVKPSSMDLKPLLLARVVKEANAIIVDVQATEFDIIILTNGIPQPIRTVPFADEAAPLEQRLTAISNELNRTITFYNSNNPDKPLAADVPVFASGYLANEASLCQALSGEVGHSVSPLQPPFECPNECDPSRFMVNMGLVLQNLSPGKVTGSSLVNLNVLPVPYQPKPISLTNILALPAAAIGIGLIALSVIMLQNASADVAMTSAELTTTEQHLQQQISQRQGLIDGVTKIENKVNELNTSLDSFSTALGSIEKAGTEMNRNLEAVLQNLPYTITLNDVTHAENTLMVSGLAPDEKEVLSYLNQLEKSGRFGSITLTGMSRTESDKMSFTMKGSLAAPSDALSSIELAVRKTPVTVTLNNISNIEGTINIDGNSPSEDEVLAYLSALDATGRFDDITVKSMRTVAGEGTSFSLTLKTKG